MLQQLKIDMMWNNLKYSGKRYYHRAMRIELKQIAWKNPRAMPGCQYSPTRIEHFLNIFTHGIWILPALFGTVELVSRSYSRTQLIAAWIYGLALIFLFVISTIFHSVSYVNCCKGHRRNRQIKDVFHRCDRAMIYVFIAGSYFPWLHLVHFAPYSLVFESLQWIIWVLAALGITYQQIFHERFKCLETFLYIVMGLGPSLVVLASGHEFPGMVELKWGGCIYIIGVCFFKSDGIIPLAHAIWHLFVALAASVHYFAILKYLFPMEL
ncbi:monocyte to macrophage differentiation factor [Condylostylus longicornis]|uniref:monocyte to macrophage differentiation factor n=1 Tax=Condylostylus longicornis TaxID=2530218 RepID=UPI00244E2CB0|nr:monocyte to macrophage differentiation factor [Condylostylus longicornis]